jgi:hypothetical protein
MVVRGSLSVAEHNLGQERPIGRKDADRKKKGWGYLHSLLGVIATLLIIAYLLVFLAAAGNSVYLGGDALNGYAQNGHYYVSSHGTTTEVTEEEWSKSLWLHQTMFYMAPVAFLAMGYFAIAHMIPFFMYGGTGSAARREKAKLLATEIAETGDLIVDARCSGEVSSLRVPSIWVRVYPGGLVVRAILSGTLGIRLADIRVLREYNDWTRRGLEITYRSKDASSGTLFLNSRGGEVLAVKAALQTLMEKAAQP